MSRTMYDENDIDHWITVRGARIPVLKDGTLGVGTKEVSVSADTIKKKMYNVNTAVQQAREAKDWKTYKEATEEYNRLSNILKETQDQEKTTSRNARYDTSRTPEGKVAEAYKNVEMAKQAWRDAEQNKLAISKRLRNEYLKKNYGATYSQMEKKGTYTNKVHQEVGKYVMSVPEFKKAYVAEKDAMSRHVSTTAILKQEYEKYRKLGGIQNADWYRASREWDDND